MRADDDGFIGNPKRIQQMIGASSDDLKLLIAKRFVISFEDGVIVIKHWKMHNCIQGDRYAPTQYIEDKKMLTVKDNKAYTLTDGMETKCIQNVSADKDLDLDIDIDKDIKDIPAPQKEPKHKYGEYSHVLLTDTELSKLKEKHGTTLTDECIKFLDEYIEMKGYKAKSHYLCIGKWVLDAVKEREKKPNAQQPKQNKFNAHQQRDYTAKDYEELERKLLNR
jgi:hypothetical protein